MFTEGGKIIHGGGGVVSQEVGRFSAGDIRAYRSAGFFKKWGGRGGHALYQYSTRNILY